MLCLLAFLPQRKLVIFVFIDRLVLANLIHGAAGRCADIVLANQAVRITGLRIVVHHFAQLPIGAAQMGKYPLATQTLAVEIKLDSPPSEKRSMGLRSMRDTCRFPKPLPYRPRTDLRVSVFRRPDIPANDR